MKWLAYCIDAWPCSSADCPYPLLVTILFFSFLYIPPTTYSQPPWRVTQSRPIAVPSMERAPVPAASNFGTRSVPRSTPACTALMKTWLPPLTASTRFLSAAPPTTPLIPPRCTSCPVLTLWLVSQYLNPLLLLTGPVISVLCFLSKNINKHKCLWSFLTKGGS